MIIPLANSYSQNIRYNKEKKALYQRKGELYMAYPRLEVNRDKLRHNLEYLSSYIHQHNIQVAGVTKVFCAHPELAKIYDEVETIDFLADSRLDNFKNYPKESTKLKLLLRIPMHSEIKKLIELTDISLNSEIETIRLISKEAKAANKTHQIILMIDLGDLREGIFEEGEVYDYVEEILSLDNIELKGLGVNLTCYGAIIPDRSILQKLVDFKHAIKDQFDYKIDLISGGNSSSLYLLEPDTEGLPDEVNMLRIGEAFVLGGETAYGQPIANMYNDIFTLKAEIIEYRDKPSLPIGNVGQDAFGNKPSFIDKGLMKRGILAIGRQDVNYDNLTPRDKRIEIIGSSSDHLIVDFTEATEDYKLGDIVEFDVSYGALLNAFTSPYVDITLV